MAKEPPRICIMRRNQGSLLIVCSPYLSKYGLACRNQKQKKKLFLKNWKIVALPPDKLEG